MGLGERLGLKSGWRVPGWPVWGLTLGIVDQLLFGVLSGAER